MWSTMFSCRNVGSSRGGLFNFGRGTHQWSASIFNLKRKQRIIEENNNLHIHKVLNNLWDILNLHLAFDIRQHLDEMGVFLINFFVVLQRLDLPGIFSSWWYQSIWEISVKLHHFPKHRGENSKKNRLKPPPATNNLWKGSRFHHPKKVARSCSSEFPPKKGMFQQEIHGNPSSSNHHLSRDVLVFKGIILLPSYVVIIIK